MVKKIKNIDFDELEYLMNLLNELVEIRATIPNCDIYIDKFEFYVGIEIMVRQRIEKIAKGS